MFSTISGIEQKAISLMNREVITIDDIYGKEEEFISAFNKAQLASLKEFTRQKKETGEWLVNRIDDVFVDKFKEEFFK